MEDATSTKCSPEKKRTASDAFSSEGGDTKKHVESSLKDSDDNNNNNSNNGTAAVVVMTVRTPTMEECVHFLERNQTMRQILGLLIDQQEQQEKMTCASAKTDETTSIDGFSLEEDDNFSDEGEAHLVKHYLHMLNDPELFLWYELTEGDQDLEYEDFLSEEQAENADFSRWNHYNDDGDETRPIIPKPPFTIPTLQALALEAASGQFQRDSKSNEQKHKKLLSALRQKTTSDVKPIFQHYGNQLGASPEAAVIHLLNSLRTIARQKIHERYLQEYDVAKCHRDEIFENANKLRAAIVQSDWLKVRELIWNDHCSFLAQHGDVNDGKLMPCFNPECRRLFDPQLVPQNKRCVEPDCMLTKPNCGCSICKGWRCGKRPVCMAHYESHMASCYERDQKTCGFNTNSNTVNRRFCNRLFDKEKDGEWMTINSTIQCCPDCFRAKS